MRAISRCRQRNSRCRPAVSLRISYRTAYESPTGEYTINVYLVKNGKRSTSARFQRVNVKEFLPDRMKIETRLSRNFRARLGRSERNAAFDRARESLRHAGLRSTREKPRRTFAAGFSFSEFRDYSFYDALLDEKRTRQRESVDLGEQKTDADGHGENGFATRSICGRHICDAVLRRGV